MLTRRRTAALLLLTGLLSAAVTPASARSSRHSDSGYGLQGGVSPVYSQANVFSGIYGYGFPDDRRRVDFNARCPSPHQAVAGYWATCPLGFSDR